MKKKRCLLLCLTLALLLALAACGSSGGGSNSAPSSGQGPPTPEAAAPDTGADGSGLYRDMSAGESQVYAGEDAKLIRRAQVSLQTTDFAAAADALDALVEAQGGYYESASVQGGGYYSQDTARFGEYVVRVPKAHYSAFLSGMEGVAHVVSLDQSSENVGEQYFDTESRLRTQQTKRERLLSLLDQAATMEDIIDLENALSEVEYQIEQYSTQLRRYDSLVDFSTISITLDEVRKVSDAAGRTDAIGTRMAAAFSNGMSGAGDALGDFAVWCAYHFVGLLILAAAVAVGVVLLVRRHRKRSAPPPAPPAPPKQDGGDKQ